MEVVLVTIALTFIVAVLALVVYLWFTRPVEGKHTSRGRRPSKSGQHHRST